MKEETNFELRKRVTYNPRDFRTQDRPSRYRVRYGFISVILILVALFAIALERYR